MDGRERKTQQDHHEHYFLSIVFRTSMFIFSVDSSTKPTEIGTTIIMIFLHKETEA